jgi:hypothetical protein
MNYSAHDPLPNCWRRFERYVSVFLVLYRLVIIYDFQCLDDGHDFPFDQLPVKTPTSPLLSKFPLLFRSSPRDGTAPSTERMVTLAFGEVLLLFLKSLQTPVVPQRLFPLIAQVASSDDTFEVCDTMQNTVSVANCLIVPRCLATRIC